MSLSAYSQTLIKGKVVDKLNGSAAERVSVRNVHTKNGMTTMEDGKFRIIVKKDQLLEFSKIGYETVRIRIQNEKDPEYYVVELEIKSIRLKEVDIRGRSLNFKRDSIRFEKTYSVILNGEQRSEIDFRSMPLAMLSKRQREKWAFQKMYAQWEQQKYIDFVYNEDLVKRITYLEGQELEYFMRRYRPSYQFLRSASQYEYLEYIKRTFHQYKDLQSR